MEDKTLTVDESKEFDNDITEYTLAEKKAMENFIQEIVKLGEILFRQRKKWKPKKQWQEYVRKIGKSVQAVNQMIRTYELAQKDIQQILDANVDTWPKLQSYLTLTPEEKKQFVEEVDSSNLSSGEYKNSVKEFKDKNILSESPDVVLSKEDEMPNVELEDTQNELSNELQELIKESSLTDVYFMSKEVLKNMNKVHNNIFSNNSLPLIESFLYSEKITRNLNGKIIKNLTPDELAYWISELKISVSKLNAKLNEL